MPAYQSRVFGTLCAQRQVVWVPPTTPGQHDGRRVCNLPVSIPAGRARISKRAREGESGISKSYLQGLEDEHEEWFQWQENVLVIDGEVDFKANMDSLVLQVEAFRQSLAATPTFDVLYK
jgi:deoxyadenosine/deoxycytidine kinase